MGRSDRRAARRFMRCWTMGILAAASLVASGPARAATVHESERAIEALLAAEMEMADAADRARSANLKAQETVALTLSRAASALGAALASGQQGAAANGGGNAGQEAGPEAEGTAEAQARGAVVAGQRLVNAGLAHAQAREALQRLLAEAGPLEQAASEHRARVASLRGALDRLRAEGPPRGEIDGRWTLELAPLDETLSIDFTQAGPFVGGTYQSSRGGGGTLMGQVAGGHVRLERHERPIGKIGDIVGMITSTGELEGTWQSTLLGTGRPEAGTFKAKREAAQGGTETAP